MRLGGDGGVRSSRKGIVRARGVCGMERRRAGCGVGKVRRGDAQNGANGAGCAEACCRRVPGRGGGAGLGLGGSASRGWSAWSWSSNGRATAPVAGLAQARSAATSDLELQALR